MARRFMCGMVALVTAGFVSACGGEQGDVADLVLLNGTVVTVDADLPEAEAIAVAGDRIVAVGSSAEIQAWVGDDTEVVDLEGRLAIPGFIEGHGHYLRLGQTQSILDLTTAASWQDIVDQVAEAAAAAQPGEWIEGHGWHQEKWESTPAGPMVDGVPVHASLDAVSPENPVFLNHASGHASYANGLALELAGIDRDTADPDGGTIVRDGSGEPTGLLRERAGGLVGAALNAISNERSEADLRAEFDRTVQLAAEEALSKGVTTFHDAGTGFGAIDEFRRLADEGRLPVRLYVMVRANNEQMAENLADYRMVGYGDDHLTVRSIKRQIDGALGSHGAWLLEEYEDMATIGMTVEEPEDIEQTARLAAEHGYQLNTHAIGDRANRVVLDMYEEVLGAEAASGDHRWRIEHAQHVDPTDVPRFAELNVIAAMQGVHATSDAPWVYARLGAERAESGAYLWRSFMDAGVVIANGTDVPVEDISPVQSFYSSFVRQDKDGNDFFPAQKMTRMEALESYTINNAYAAFEEDLKGSITVGKLADIAVLDRNIMTVPEAEVRDALVDLTIVGGDVLYRRGN